MDKITKINDFFVYIKNSNKDFSSKIKNSGGWTLWFRALLAQILWLTFLYQIGILLIPLKNFLGKNLLMAGILIGLSLVWKALKEHMPCWVDDFFKGGIYYKCNNVKVLNKVLFLLFAMNAGVLYFNAKKAETE